MIKAGKIIYKALKDNAELDKITNGRLYPIVAPLDAKIPFVVYSRSGHSVSTFKHGYGSESADLSISIVSNDYEESVDIADVIVNALKNASIQGYDIVFQGSSERYSESYVQELNFKISK